jgi:hypothetical protein
MNWYLLQTGCKEARDKMARLIQTRARPGYSRAVKRSNAVQNCTYDEARWDISSADTQLGLGYAYPREEGKSDS